MSFGPNECFPFPVRYAGPDSNWGGRVIRAGDLGFGHCRVEGFGGISMQVLFGGARPIRVAAGWLQGVDCGASLG